MRKVISLICISIASFSCVPEDERTFDLFYGFQLGMAYEDFYKKVNDNINNENLLLYDYTPPPLIIDSDTFPGKTYQELKVKLDSDRNDLKYWEFRPTFFNDDLLVLQLSNDSIDDTELAKSFFENFLNVELIDKDDQGYEIIKDGGLGVLLEEKENGGVQLSLYDKVGYDKRNSLAQTDKNSLMWNESGDSWTEEHFEHFKNELPIERISNNAW